MSWASPSGGGGEDGQNVSRSGRVRKKSSKLTDFQSPEEAAETVRQRRASKKGGGGGSGEEDINFTSQIFQDEGSDSDLLQDLDMDIDMELRLEDLEDLQDFEEDGFGSPPPVAAAGASPRSQIIKKPANLPLSPSGGSHHESGGGLLFRSAPGSSPGNTSSSGGTKTISAFLLWAKHVKPEVERQHPHLSNTELGAKLGEIWTHTVTKTEKQAWSIKARRLSSLSPLKRPGGGGGGGGGGGPLEVKKGSPVAPSSSHDRRTAAARVAGGGGGGAPAASTTTGAARITTGGGSAARGRPVEPLGLPSTYRVGGSAPVNVAAHLRLLGESLQVIGERLTEHNGVIAVSGSLSVLLDSILCAMGPLLCLTQRVPELNGADPAVLHEILDNVAYIMPGL